MESVCPIEMPHEGDVANNRINIAVESVLFTRYNLVAFQAAQHKGSASLKEGQFRSQSLVGVVDAAQSEPQFDF